MVITQNGEAKAVLQEVAPFEETKETLALLKILALGNHIDESLSRFPQRGSYPKQRVGLGIQEYRQTFFSNPTA